MELARKIMNYAGSLFDVVGFSRHSSGETLLITGLESTAERNLDEFGLPDGDFHLIGFEKYVHAGLEKLLDFIRNEGIDAELIGKLGYPRKREVNLKEEAIRAGLCRRVKNTLVVHPRYGTRLRFMAIRINAQMELPAQSALTEEENSSCSGCTICLDACPVKILEPYRMLNTSACLSNTTTMTKENGLLIPCDLCVHLCPLNRE